MQLFITGTDTNIGKTLISAWICIHTGYCYFKPIQTGSIEGTDTEFIKQISLNTITYKEAYNYKNPLSPHLASHLEGEIIDMYKIQLPSSKNLIVEGAGGILTPLNSKNFVVDMIKYFNIPVIVVARSSLGTINHTLLTLEALRARDINPSCVIMNGKKNAENIEAIERYGKTKVHIFPQIKYITYDGLKTIVLPEELANILRLST